MKRVITFGPYEWSEKGFWFQRDYVQEGAVRVIDNRLLQAVPHTIEFDEPKYDTKTQSMETSEKVWAWVPIDD